MWNKETNAVQIYRSPESIFFILDSLDSRDGSEAITIACISDARSYLKVKLFRHRLNGFKSQIVKIPSHQNLFP